MARRERNDDPFTHEGMSFLDLFTEIFLRDRMESYRQFIEHNNTAFWSQLIVSDIV